MIHGTTILCITHEGETVMAGDGQVTQNQTILKARARKVRSLFGGRILAGFAGGTADALTLCEHFEKKLEKHSGDLVRAAVELAKDWRTDRVLRRLEALLVVSDGVKQLLLTGQGDVIEPDEGVVGIGSGGPYAKAAAVALKRHSSLSAEEIAREAMRIAGETCVFTNQELTLEKIARGTRS
jgi:ATP-dependent HslUV protease subunit HslV